ncbi:MAG TPA: hypothetical protein VD902_18720, partial [Symbiobacteriaceae bacterium]|nr:hypothetical protein [Symbiobacteriaceae bacterium]
MIDRTSLPADVQSLLENAKLERVEVRGRAQEVRLFLQVPRRIPLTAREQVAAAVAAGCFPGLSVAVRLFPAVNTAPS